MMMMKNKSFGLTVYKIDTVKKLILSLQLHLFYILMFLN
jgi:hypothetical protein